MCRRAESFLENHDRWFIKAEFGPDWPRSQGTNPEEFLEWLIGKFNVYEMRKNCLSSCELRKSLGMPLTLAARKISLLVRLDKILDGLISTSCQNPRTNLFPCSNLHAGNILLIIEDLETVYECRKDQRFLLVRWCLQ